MIDLKLDKVKYIIFDWDNTLAESKTPLLYAMEQVIKEKQLPSWSELEKKRDYELSFKENFANFFGGRAEEIYQRYAEIYLQNMPQQIKTFQGVCESLKLLSERKIKLMVMSNKDRKLLEQELPLLFDPCCFERVVCGQEAPKDKPHKEHVLHTLRGYLKPAEITPEKVWVVGDSPQDSNAALACNARPIRIGQNIWPESETPSDQVLYLRNFMHFYELLQVQN